MPPPYEANDTMTLRKAKLHDLDDLIDIAFAAFPFDPQFDYVHPHWRTYPEHNRAFMREFYTEALEDAKTITNVICVKQIVNGKEEDRPVSLAAWLIPQTPTSAIPPAHGNEQRLDGDPKRTEAYLSALATARQKYFKDRYGNGRIHLRSLATHPDFQHQGLATKHCAWGMELAKEDNLPITLFCSPMAQKLYAHLGFKLLGTFPVQVDGEEEKVSVAAMVFQCQDSESSPSNKTN